MKYYRKYMQDQLHPTNFNTLMRRCCTVSHLHFHWKQVHIAILLQEFASACQVLVGCAHNIQDWQELPQAHGEILCHPAAPCVCPHILGCCFKGCLTGLRSIAVVDILLCKSVTLQRGIADLRYNNFFKFLGQNVTSAAVSTHLMRTCRSPQSHRVNVSFPHRVLFWLHCQVILKCSTLLQADRCLR